jgi:hypothetical protein
MGKIIAIAGAASVVSLTAGLAVGYKLAVNRLELKYNDMLVEELAKTKAYYERNTNPFPSPMEALKTLKPALVEKTKEEVPKKVDAPEIKDDSPEIYSRIVQDLKYNKVTPASDRPPVVEIKEEVVTVDSSIFDGDLIDPENDPEHEEMMDNRESETIFIVSKEEHLENPHEFEMTALTYYAGDNVLVAENDQPIGDIEGTIGHKENLQFGRWSQDVNVVYIRNEVLGEEFEIFRSKGKYAVEVLGLDSD